MHLVGFTIEIYYDARSCERHMCRTGFLELRQKSENVMLPKLWCFFFIAANYSVFRDFF